MLRDRLNRAIELYRAGVSDRFLLTGDHGRKGYNEVQGMKDYIMANLDVPEDKIFMDHAGFSTYESMYRARDIFEVHNPVVVTQKYHAYRAVYAARKLGLDAYAAPNKRMKYRNIWICKLREVAARDKEVVNLWIQPKPTYLEIRFQSAEVDWQRKIHALTKQKGKGNDNEKKQKVWRLLLVLSLVIGMAAGGVQSQAYSVPSI